MFKFTAISPKLPLVGNNLPKVEARMRKFAGEGVRAMAKYPASRPSAYRRTGTLGRGWTYRYSRQGGSLIADIQNPVPYAVWVQGGDAIGGPRQSARMAARGWQTTTDAVEPLWEAAIKEIADLLNG